MHRYNIWVSSWEMIHQNLVRAVREQVAGLLVERDQRPHLPTAQAMVVVAAQILRKAEHYFSPPDLQRYDEAAAALRETLNTILREERGKLFGQKLARQEKDAGQLPAA